MKILLVEGKLRKFLEKKKIDAVTMHLLVLTLSTQNLKRVNAHNSY